MNVTILALDGVFDTGLAVMLDAFGTANELAAMQGGDVPFRVHLVGVRPEVTSALGMKVPVQAACTAPAPDLVVIPAPGYKMPGPLTEALKRDDMQEAACAIRAWADQGARIAAACIGTFLVAESGALDGHDATSTWWLTPMFRERYPKVRLDTDRILVASGQFLTAGAALSHLDMCLSLIRQVSPDLAALVASYLIVDERPSQSAYMITDHLAHADPLVEKFDRWVRARLAEGFRIEQAAASLATSKRTLARRMQEVLGKSPIEYVQDLRIERAVHLLRTSADSVERIAEKVGYADGVTLRNLIRRRLGKGIRELRQAA